MTQLLSSFIKQHGFPWFSFSSIRRSAAVAHHHVSGSLLAASVRLNHASINTTSHYTKGAEQIQRYHDTVIQHFQGLMVQASLNSEQTLEPSSGS
jgi:hypothetical protein